MSTTGEDRRVIKCVVWDLDNTLWQGTLLEDHGVSLREEVAQIVRALDARGILQSIASKNDHEQAFAKLRDIGLSDFFLYPQIGWGRKSASIKAIAEAVNISVDSVAFIDDQPFELEEVKLSLPDVMCIGADRLACLLDMPEMNPRFVTDDSGRRRLMYLNDIERKRAEDDFEGPQESFLATLGMEFTVGPAREEDLKRAEELTVRTHQLNTTGYTYSYNELDEFRRRDDHLLLIAGLTDKFGSYGKIGLALVECGEEVWVVKQLLMSCRVMSRGVGMIMLSHIMRLAKEANVRLRAELIPTGRNRLMYVAYKFSHFREVAKEGEKVIFESDLSRVPDFPRYVKVTVTT